MKVRRIEHVAMTVNDLDAGRAFWEGVLGIRCEGVEDFDAARVQVALYPVGDSMVELLCGTTPDSAYARQVREQGPALHHVCLEVDDLDGALAELRAKGVKLRDETPRPGHSGSRIAFLDPTSTGQILVELVELPGREANAPAHPPEGG